MQRNGTHGKIVHAVVPLALLFVIIAFDQLTKCYFHQYDLEGGERITVIKDFLFWDVSYNTGAAFSFLSDTAWGQILFKALTVVALIAVYIYYLYIKDKYVFVKYALMVLTAGVIGNFIDRLAFDKVVDFISVQLWGGKYFPTFNVADSAITVGVIMFIVHFLFLDAECLFCSKETREKRKARLAALSGKTEPAEEKDGENGK